MNFNMMELMSNIVPFITIGFVFYFFLIRPQQQKAKKHNDMLLALKKGDKIITSGGIIGTIYKIQSDQEVILEIAHEINIHIDRSAILGLFNKNITTTDNIKTK